MNDTDLRLMASGSLSISGAQHELAQTVLQLRTEVARLIVERDALRAEAARIADDYQPEKGQEVLALSEMREAISNLANNALSDQKTAPHTAPV